MQATKAIIHLDNLVNNIRAVRSLLGPGKKICVPVKANAYGHGAVAVAKAAVKAGVEYLGIATTDEAAELRDSGIECPIVLFGYPQPEEIPVLFRYRITPVVASKEFVLLLHREAERTRCPLSVHLKIDTGMGRLGCRPEDALGIAEEISRNPFLKLDGCCTHYPGSDMQDIGFARQQLGIFRTIVSQLKEKGIDPGILHTANSGALISMEESYLDMIRPGILVYGYYPSDEQKRFLKVSPVMELKTKISFLKKVPAGTPVSYSMTYRTKSETLIATIPAGYADGYSRQLSSRGQVLIKGKRYPVAGRVCMDQTMIDLGSAADIAVSDDVTLFGPDPAGPDAEEIARLMGTIPYEVTCLITKRVPRVYTGDDGSV